MEPLVRIPIAEDKFIPDENTGPTPSIFAYSRAVRRLMARRLFLEQLPKEGQMAVFMQEFLNLWREFRKMGDLTPFDKELDVLADLAKLMNDTHAVKVLKAQQSYSHRNPQNPLVRGLYISTRGQQALPFDPEHSDFKDIRALFGEDSAFVVATDNFLKHNTPADFLDTVGWRKEMAHVIRQIPDYWKRTDVPEDISQDDYKLCEPLDARIIEKEYYVFDWAIHQPSRVGIQQGRKVLGSWSTGRKTAQNDFAPLSVTVHGLHTTKGYFWLVTYRDVDELVDPKTYQVLASLPRDQLYKDTLLMRNDAPTWRLDPVKKTLTTPSVWEKVRHWTQ